jgi:hypothetical protein
MEDVVRECFVLTQNVSGFALLVYLKGTIMRFKWSEIPVSAVIFIRFSLSLISFRINICPLYLML